LTVRELCRTHPRFGLDSNVFIYLFEGSGREADVASALVEAIAGGAATGTLAMLGLAEILTGPARADDAALTHRYADELLSLEGLSVPAMGREVALEAALVRGSAAQLSLGDAIHLASARLDHATAFVTNDRRLRAINGLEVVYLRELAAG
jgi:predicted nucleic acid-binding protein